MIAPFLWGVIDFDRDTALNARFAGGHNKPGLFLKKISLHWPLAKGISTFYSEGI
jgi:hypothetical protein